MTFTASFLSAGQILKQDSLGRVRRQVADLSPQKRAEKKFSLKQCGVDAVSVVAFAYDTYTNPSNDNGVLGGTLTPILLILS